jgi:Holliday junction resolvase
MGLHRYNPKRDKNELEIIAALEKVGASVRRVSGEDLPDLWVGYNGRDYHIEVKTRRGRLTNGQAELIRTWRGGQIKVAWSIEDALRILGFTCRKAHSIEHAQAEAVMIDKVNAKRALMRGAGVLAATGHDEEANRALNPMYLVLYLDVLPMPTIVSSEHELNEVLNGLR